jgi:hypothetical protein
MWLWVGISACESMREFLALTFRQKCRLSFIIYTLQFLFFHPTTLNPWSDKAGCSTHPPNCTSPYQYHPKRTRVRRSSSKWWQGEYPHCPFCVSVSLPLMVTVSSAASLCSSPYFGRHNQHIQPFLASSCKHLCQHQLNGLNSWMFFWSFFYGTYATLTVLCWWCFIYQLPSPVMGSVL